MKLYSLWGTATSLALCKEIGEAGII